jgi:hypothetical protein
MSYPGIHRIADIVLADFNRARETSQEDSLFLGKPFQSADGKVIPENQGNGLKKLKEEFGEKGSQLIGALGKSLHHQMVSVSVHDQRGDSVRLPVNQPIGGRIPHEGLPELGCSLKPPFPEFTIDGPAFPGNQAENDLGSVAVKSLGEEFPVLFLQCHDGPGRCVMDLLQVIAEDPGMTLLEPGKAFRSKCETAHILKFGMRNGEWGILKHRR